MRGEAGIVTYTDGLNVGEQPCLAAKLARSSHTFWPTFLLAARQAVMPASRD